MSLSCKTEALFFSHHYLQPSTNGIKRTRNVGALIGIIIGSFVIILSGAVAFSLWRRIGEVRQVGGCAGGECPPVQNSSGKYLVAGNDHWAEEEEGGGIS